MSKEMEISVDKLPIKRLQHIEESGVEHFPPDIGYDEKTVNLIRRVDFAWAVERDTKKPKKAKETSGPSTWQGLVENLQLAHQELQVIIDLINTVETNDAVAVAAMTRPKSLPNEVMSDLAVSMATKLQGYRHLSKYFKQSAKALEQQVAREGRFYGALIRLQQNWKVKRHRLAGNALNSEGFLIDLTDNSGRQQQALAYPPFSVVRVDHDSSGMLSVHMPPNSSRSFHFDFLGIHSHGSPEKTGEGALHVSEESPSGTIRDAPDDDERIRETHKVLRDAHRAIFYEQVFELVSRESFNPSLGVNVTGLRESYLELSISPGVSVFLSLEQHKGNSEIRDAEEDRSLREVSEGLSIVEKKPDGQITAFPNHYTYQIYLQKLFHDEMFGKVKDKSAVPSKSQYSQQMKDAEGLVSHLCLSMAHRIFSSKVFMELENLVMKVPYLQLITQPTWHSRSSSWTLFVKIPPVILNARSQTPRSDDDDQIKTTSKSLFQTNVVVKDNSISVEGGGAPNAVGLFKTNPETVGSKHRFSCDLVDLPMVLLLQVASQIIQWLHDEALMVGIKTNRDFLSLSLELDRGERLNLVAHVDPDDRLGCISWWLTLEDGFTKEHKLQADFEENDGASRQFLGYLSLDALYTALMDFLSLSTSGVSH